MDKDILKLVDGIEGSQEGLQLSDNSRELIAMFIEDIMKHENVTAKDITKAGSGKTCSNLKIGEYILKVGTTRRTKEFRNSSRILQPIIRREIAVNSDEKLFIEVQNEVDVDWAKPQNKPYEVMYQVYRDLRDDGLLWTDIRFANIGRLKKDNRVNYTTLVHDENENKIEKEIEPEEKATGLKGMPSKVLKAGEYVLLDTDFVFDVNDLPDGKKIKDMLLPLYYENFEMRYQREKRNKENDSLEK